MLTPSAMETASGFILGVENAPERPNVDDASQPLIGATARYAVSALPAAAAVVREVVT
jgi:hypothetical protein